MFALDQSKVLANLASAGVNRGSVYNVNMRQVVPVEPGVYFVDPILVGAIGDPSKAKYLNLDVLARFRKNVGEVRIEDDVAITATGIDNLTGWVPKDVADVEAVMA